MMRFTDLSRTMSFDLYRSKFGDFLPLIRRQDVKGFIKRKPLWLTGRSVSTRYENMPREAH